MSPRRILPCLAFAISVLPSVPWTSRAAASSSSADWPQWHGAQRNGHAASPTLAEISSLPSDLKPEWRIPVGPGHSAPVISGARLVYSSEDGTNEVAHCLDANSGALLWQASYAPRFEDEWGAGPRSTPFLADPMLFVQSCRGEFRALDLASGKILWGFSAETNYGVEFLGPGTGGGSRRRGHAGSGVVEGDLVIVPVGGTNQATLVACERASGKVRWRTGTDETAYSSLVVEELHGIRQVIVFTAEALSGFRASDGEMLWRYPLRTAARRHAATPRVWRNLVIVNSHTFGMTAVRIDSEGDSLRATEAWTNPDLRINVATSTEIQGHLYSQGARRDFVCVDAATGRLRWSQPGFGSGRRDYASVIASGDRLLVLNDEGTLLLLRANPTAYQELGRLQICGSTWAHPALVDDRLYVRDTRSLACYRLPR